jgi:hypothetical protein
MFNQMRKGLILLVAFMLLAAPLNAMAAGGGSLLDDQGNNSGRMMADLFLCRPLGLAATVFGYAFSLAALPFSLPGKNAEPVFEKMFFEPAQYTFARPLGEF